MQLSIALDRIWVLPPFMESKQWGTPGKGPYPFEDYYDVDHMHRSSNGTIRVITLAQFIATAMPTICPDANNWVHYCVPQACQSWPLAGGKKLPFPSRHSIPPSRIDQWSNASCIAACHCATHSHLTEWFPEYHEPRPWQVGIIYTIHPLVLICQS
jgi:hypothetical protein